MTKTFKILGAAVAVIGAALSSNGAATATTYTHTNVFQNVSINFTVYSQGPTNSTGTKISDVKTSLQTKDIIAEMEAIPALAGFNFGKSPKLLYVTTYSNLTIFLQMPVLTNLDTNLPIPLSGAGTNVTEDIGIYSLGINTNVGVLSNLFGYILELYVNGAEQGEYFTNTLVIATNGTTTASATFNTNSGYTTTFIPTTNAGGMVTNIEVINTSGTPTNVFTNVGTMTVIQGGTSSAPLYTNVTPYLSGYPDWSRIVSAVGKGLLTTNPLTVTNLTSETVYTTVTFNIGFFGLTGMSNLSLAMHGFITSDLKVDSLSKKPVIMEDIFGANSQMTAVGHGYAWGTYTTNPAAGNAINVTQYAFEYGTNGSFITGSITNPVPVVVQGTVNVNFLNNVPEP